MRPASSVSTGMPAFVEGILSNSSGKHVTARGRHLETSAKSSCHGLGDSTLIWLERLSSSSREGCFSTGSDFFAPASRQFEDNSPLLAAEIKEPFSFCAA